MNTDIEEIRDEVWMGMTGRELVYTAAGIVIALLLLLFLVLVVKLPLTMCVYICIPCIAPFVFLGMYHPQGMTLLEYAKARRRRKQMQKLSYEAGELTDEVPVWSMERKKAEG